MIQKRCNNLHVEETEIDFSWSPKNQQLERRNHLFMT